MRNMIRIIDTWEPCEHFLRQYWADKPAAERDRLLSDLAEVFAKKGDLCFGAFDGERMMGLFVFSPLEEAYFVTRRWLTRSEGAGREMLAHLKRAYPACEVEFTFSPRDTLLRRLLAEVGATVFPEQRNMELAGPVPPVDTAGVVPLSKAFEPAYFALHRDSDPAGETYWTGEMVAADQEGFSVLLALEQGVPVGYLDLGLGEGGNNVADLYVDPIHRRKGWGQKLLRKAVERTGMKPLMLQVDVDNGPALALYEGMGFRFRPEDSWMDAIWRIQG